MIAQPLAFKRTMLDAKEALVRSPGVRQGVSALMLEAGNHDA